MSNVYRGPSMDASYQVSVHLTPGCSGEEMIMRIRSVLKGLQKTYWMLNITDDKFLQPFREVISA
jgi:hypothetical protein